MQRRERRSRSPLRCGSFNHRPFVNVLRKDPATNEELGTIPEMGLAETKDAIEAASTAFKTWSRITAKVHDLALEMHSALIIPPKRF